jgi:D-lactate dehydrogenase
MSSKMKKLLSVDPAKIGRPPGSGSPDAVPDELCDGTPAPLRQALEKLLGPGRVLHRLVDLVRYASDASPYRLVPQVVVVAHDEDDVAKVLQFCLETDRHATFRAAGTSLNGQALSDEILIDVRKFFGGIKGIGERGLSIKAGVGTILSHANAHLAPYRRKIGPDPASSVACTLGGVVSNNSGGMRCTLSQNAYQTVSALTFVLVSGTKIDTSDPDAEQRFLASEPELANGLLALQAEILADDELVGRIRRKYSIRNTHGYRLDAFLDSRSPLEIFRRLLVGSEGTLGFISDVTFSTVEVAAVTSVAWIAVPSINDAIALVPDLVALGASAVELMIAPALRAAAAAFPGTPEYWKSLDLEAAALLIEIGASDEESLTEKQALVMHLTDQVALLGDLTFTSHAEAIELAWHVREGLLGLVGKQRPLGSLLITEDVCFPPLLLASAAHDLQDLLRKHGFMPGVAGHAAHGNLHFTLIARFDEEEGRATYAKFMEELVDLVVRKYDGSLKAEHGTGLNMAPFITHEWGEQATNIMWRIKNLADPKSVLAPNVILSRDPDIHLKSFKSLPPIENVSNASQCIECGFCEPVCPSRNVSMTPRQRIVVRREMARQREDSPILRRLQEQYQYDAIQTCAGDGSCSVPCPIGINTGELMREFRRRSQSETSDKVALSVAKKWNAVERVSTVALTGARYLGTTIGWRPLKALADTARKFVSADILPTVPGPMPKPAARRMPKTVREGADAVYFTACVNRMFGRDPDTARDAISIQEALVRVSNRGGKKLWIPPDIGGLCCATPFSSKGFVAAHDFMANAIAQALLRWSDEGRLPVVVDAASCTHGLVSGIAEHLTPELRERYSRLSIIDSVTWCASLLPNLKVTTPLKCIILHPTCAMLHLNLSGQLRQVAQHMAQEVVVPIGATCCGTAGDRGLLHPELIASATREEHAYVDATTADAYVSANRTCEMGLRHVTGKPYESFVFSLEQCTRGT